MKNLSIAIDGPAGSGKSTIAKILAKKYSMTYLDTGAMYRIVTLYALRNNVDLDNLDAVKEMLENIHMDIVENTFYLNSEDVSTDIRTPEVTANVSKVAAVKEIREKMVELQREIAKGKSSILDGRDIGTVVFPNADLKIFLIASPSERARRRVRDYEVRGIEGESYEEVLAAIIKRDHLDSTREESPLRKASDAIEIDSSLMAAEEVVEIISAEIDKIKG